MIENRLKKTAIITAVFAIISLGVMFYRAATKNVMIAEATGDQLQSTFNKDSFNLDIKVSNDAIKRLIIPLEADVRSDEITLHDEYVNHQFVLYINGKDPDFYRNNALISSLENLNGATCTPISEKGDVCITLFLDDMYESDTVLGDRTVEVTFKKPEAGDEKVVVIDPVDEYGAAVAPYLQKELVGIEGVKFYYTRISDSERTVEAVKEFLSATEPVLYVQVGAMDESGAGGGIRTLFNDRYFIRSFGNLEFADRLEAAVVSATGNSAIGLFPEEKENELLMASKVPSAYVQIGNTTDESDKKRLSEESYQKKCATGIADGIKNSLGILYPEENEEGDALQGIINGN